MRRKRSRLRKTDLPEKANKILNSVLVALVLVALKVWHLSIIQHDKKLEESQKPQRRVVVERSERATISDRFGIPLAVNKVQYNAFISYAPIRNLPRSRWKTDANGKRSKYPFRKTYIALLAEKLGQELSLEPEYVEDLIHSKAAIFGNAPCLIKENLSEEEYFRLKMLAKDWPGIHAETAAKRFYPQGPIAGEIVGYIGPISRSEYDSIMREMGNLREKLAAYEEGIHDVEPIEEIRARLEEIEKKAYHLNDFVGKIGVEGAFDKDLRGLCGKQIYLANTRGNLLEKLPGSEESAPGKHLVLSISSELQAYAQQLLAEYAAEPFNTTLSVTKRRESIPELQPWIKAGAIVALDPKTAEIYAMASFPTFNPNDFIRGKDAEESLEKERGVQKWLESSEYIGSVWDLKRPYSREKFYPQAGVYGVEEIELNWENYLRFVLPEVSPVRKKIEEYGTVGDALHVQNCISRLLSLFDNLLPAAQVIDRIYPISNNRATGGIYTLAQKQFYEERSLSVLAELEALKQELAPYFDDLQLNYDKLLLVDLYRIVVNAPAFTSELAAYFGSMSLNTYREACARYVNVLGAVRTIVKDVFCEKDFRIWRENHFKAYLDEKRQEEKEARKKYARPYIEYLELVRKELFSNFWEENQWDFLCFFLSGGKLKPQLERGDYQNILSEWLKELNAGAHQGLDWVYHFHRLRGLTEKLDSQLLIAFLQSARSFQQLEQPLMGKYTGLRGIKEKDLASAFYPTYGFGFARSHAFRQNSTIGSIFKLVPAYEALRQRYLSHKEEGRPLYDLNPLTIVDDKHRVWGKHEVWNVGYTVEGKPIPMLYHGERLPRSDHAGIGKVDLVKALEASSNPYFALLAGEVLEDPEDLCKAANLFGYGEKTGIELPGEYAGRLPRDVAYNRTGLYAMAIGQHSLVGTPLQTALMLAAVSNGGEVLKPQVLKTEEAKVRWRVFLPAQIQEMLISGLRQVILGEKGTARVIKQQFDPLLVSHMVGKTSTAEALEKMSLDGANGYVKLNHVGFGAIAYKDSACTDPELVVVVYLKYGEWGKHAAPLAAEIIKKWRSIKSQHP